ncbi:CynX/NimT family MFS transporter [Paenarthrobacter sp. NPDC091669]|uniref:MFS transporter n=1 Tax=Paenarthrobacter sp. NPDC091669 TaxID=3364384 RepID=UPI003805A542
MVAVGFVAALHIWKLPAALPLIQNSLGFSLLTAGVLLGIVQLAGMIGGLAVSLLAEVFGARRTLILGLLFLSAGSVAGALATEAGLLLASRAVEGLGFIVASVVGPGLIRSHTSAQGINLALGLWSAHQGTATLLGLVASTLLLQVTSWQVLWWTMAGVTLIPIPLVLRFVPADHRTGTNSATVAVKRIGVTAKSGWVWISGMVFGCYTIQWMAVVGFLPTVYAGIGLTGVVPGVVTGVVGGLNAVGAVLTGVLLHRGASAKPLLLLSFGLMAATSTLTFVVDWSSVQGGMAWQGACVGLFSLSGAMVPSTMTRMAVDLAPEGGSAPAAMGLMQQIFNIGNFTGPMLVAWLAMTTGGWSSTWWMTATFSTIGIALSLALLRKPNGFQLPPVQFESVRLR